MGSNEPMLMTPLHWSRQLAWSSIWHKALESSIVTRKSATWLLVRVCLHHWVHGTFKWGTIRWHREGRLLTHWENCIMPCSGDVWNSFQEVTQMSLKPRQFFSFKNISTETVPRGIQSFDWNGLWLVGWLSNGQNFFVKFAQTCDKQMLKISRGYLDSCLS